MFKKVIILLAFTSISLLFAKEKTNHSLNFSLKKAEIAFKKSSFKNRLNKAPKISLDQITVTSDKKLQVIAIKLDSIKELHKKNLLKKEVLSHTLFYKDFLAELKNNNIKSEEFLFLENEVLKITLIDKDKKHASHIITLFSALGFSILFLFALLYKLFLKRNNIQIQLTKQEEVIKGLVVDGKTNKQIATELHISLSTVKTHLYNIYKKLNISKRNDLIAEH